MRKTIKRVLSGLIVLLGVGAAVVAIQTPAAAGPWCYPQQPFQVGGSTLNCEGPYSTTLIGTTITTRAFRASVTIFHQTSRQYVTVTLQPWTTYYEDDYIFAECQANKLLNGGSGTCHHTKDTLHVHNISLILPCKPTCGYDSSPPPPTYPPETAPNYHPSVSYANLYYVATFATAPGKMGSTVVGYLYAYPSNYVFCKKEWGVTTGTYGYNKWWLYTDLDTGGRGWVSAYYLSNYGNNEAYANGGGAIPICP